MFDQNILLSVFCLYGNLQIFQAAADLGKADSDLANRQHFDVVDHDGHELLDEPLVVVPRALVLRIGVEGVLEPGQIFLDGGKRYDIVQVVDLATKFVMQKGHQFAAIMPGRVVREILLNHLERDRNFLLDKRFFHIIQILTFEQVCTNPHFLQVTFDDPRAIIPAVEVALIHLKHLGANFVELCLHQHGVERPHWLDKLALELEAFFERPLPLEPECVAFGTSHDALDQELELVPNHFQLLLHALVALPGALSVSRDNERICAFGVVHFREQVIQDFSPIIPQRSEIRRNKREFFCLHQSFVVVFLVGSFLLEYLIVAFDFFKLGRNLSQLLFCELLLGNFFPTVKHF